MWKILVMERMPLSMDRGLCMPCFSTSSACFYHMYMLPLFILTDIYFQITSKCNNVRLVLSNTGSGLFCRIGTVLTLFCCIRILMLHKHLLRPSECLWLNMSVCWSEYLVLYRYYVLVLVEPSRGVFIYVRDH